MKLTKEQRLEKRKVQQLKKAYERGSEWAVEKMMDENICQGCYQSPCVCLPNDALCDPE